MRDRDDCARCEPPLVGVEFQTEPRVVDTQIAVSATCYRLRNNLLHLLGHDADICFVAAVVAKAIEAEASPEMAEQSDVVLESNVRSSSATATATTTAAGSSGATATGAGAGAASAAATASGAGAASGAACATTARPAGLRG